MKPTILTIILAVIVAGGVTSCDEHRQELGTQSLNRNWQVITIDGCEYIEEKHSHACPLIHKGNCKNPIHLTH